MVQDESRHSRAWCSSSAGLGGEGERDRISTGSGTCFLEADTLEEKVFLMQVFSSA